MNLRNARCNDKINNYQKVVLEREITPDRYLCTERRVIGARSILIIVIREKNKQLNTSRGRRIHVLKTTRKTIFTNGSLI